MTVAVLAEVREQLLWDRYREALIARLASDTPANREAEALARDRFLEVFAPEALKCKIRR